MIYAGCFIAGVIVGAFAMKTLIHRQLFNLIDQLPDDIISAKYRAIIARAS